MASWATLEFYKEDYLMGDTPLIPDQSFLRWEQAARTIINRNNITVDEPPAYLMRCVCEVAEALYAQNQAPKPGDLKSESNAGYSWTAEQARNIKDFNADIRAIIIKHLTGTELHNDFIYAGVR